jgi:Methylase involved in ubiquinone/menaquinone biosynthesis
MNETSIRTFWNSHPCGEDLIGSAHRYTSNYEAFFRRYDEYRYRTEAHIPQCLDAIGFKGQRTLEIGLGQGADSEQIIRRGAIWSGLDLTPESVERVRLRLALRQLPFEALEQGSALAIPFNDRTFDIVYSHGVLHHIPDIERAQEEIHRVLKPQGELVVMLYAKWSLNYLLSIALLRRLGLILLYGGGYTDDSIYGRHLENARQMGLAQYLRMKNFIHRNTDGPLNPYAKVYDLAQVRQDFRKFKVVRAYKRFMHAPPLPVGWLPLQRALGWHLWVHLRPVSG